MSQEHSLQLYGRASVPMSVNLSQVPSFSLSGTMSFNELSDTDVSAAFSVLSRYSASGVDPCTSMIGQMMCLGFQLGDAGLNRMRMIIKNLPSQSMVIGKIINMGFGVNSLVYDLSSTVQGGILVAIAATCAECYHEDQAANILWEMAHSFAQDRESVPCLPSLLQWKSLVQQAAGVLSSDKLPQIAEFFMSLHPNNRLNLETTQAGYLGQNRRNVAKSAQVAKAFLAVGKVSKGTLDSVTIKGTADGGCIAAFADRFLNLRISILDEKSSLLFANHASHESSQVHFIYTDASDEAREGLHPTDIVFQMDAATYPVLGGDMNAYGCALISGRVPWDRALGSTFGKDFDVLLQNKHIFAEAIGSAARILQAVAHANSNVDPVVRRGHQIYLGSSYGKKLALFATDRFPELKPLEHLMQPALRFPFRKARTLFDSSMGKLRTVCDCYECRACVSQKDDASSVDTSQASDGEDPFCLPILVSAIISLIQSLAGIRSGDLLPTRAGIEYFYEFQHTMRTNQRNPLPMPKWARCIDSNLKDGFGESAWLLDQVQQYSRGNGQWTPLNRFDDAVTLFSGRKIDITKELHTMSAVCVSGICVFLQSLESISERKEDLTICRVIPGHIEFSGHTYSRVADFEETDLISRVLFPRLEDAPDQLPQLTGGWRFSHYKARPSTNELRVSLCMQHEGGASWLIGPASSTQEIIRGSGFISCRHNHSGKISSGTHDQIDTLFERGPHKVWAFRGDLASRLVAIDKCHRRGLHVMWGANECIDCCIGATHPDEQTLILSSCDGVATSALSHQAS